jgi:hypothetical protein
MKRMPGSSKSLWASVLDISASPLWTPLRVLIALVGLAGLILGLYLRGLTPDVPKRLIVTQNTAKALIEFPGARDTDQAQLLVGGKPERDLRLFTYRIQYKGSGALRAQDFEGPLRGSIPPDRKLLSIQAASNLEGPTIFENGQLRRDPTPPISFNARILDGQHFVIEPLLMNQNEWFGVEIYTSSSDDAIARSSPTPVPHSIEEYRVLESEVGWNCRIAGVKCPATLDLDLDLGGWIQPWYLQVHLAHNGWAVYGLVFFTTVNLVLLVVLARSGPIGRTRNTTQIFLLAVAVPMSLGYAEILVYWLIPQMIPVEQQWGVQTVFWLNLAILILMAFMAIRERKRNRRISSGALGDETLRQDTGETQ